MGSCRVPLDFADIAVLHEYCAESDGVLAVGSLADAPDAYRALKALVSGCEVSASAVEAHVCYAYADVSGDIVRSCRAGRRRMPYLTLADPHWVCCVFSV